MKPFFLILARKAFVTVGKKIKEYREREFQRNVLETELEDPADNDPELMRKLQENKKISEKKVSEVINIVNNAVYYVLSTKNCNTEFLLF